MKKILFTLLAGACLQTVLAQVKEGKVFYERKTDMHKKLPPESEHMKQMIPQFNINKQQLIFSGDESIFSSLAEEADIRDEAMHDDGRINIKMTGGNNETYKNYATEKTVELRELGPKKYIIEDSLVRTAWKLSDDSMTIKGFHCKKATASNRQGDALVAWYTEEIPSPSGPEQFGGLPGLILQLDIGNGWIVFTPLEVSPAAGKQLVKIPSGAKKVTRAAFQKMMDEAFGPGTGGPQIRIITRGGPPEHNN